MCINYFFFNYFKKKGIKLTSNNPEELSAGLMIEVINNYFKKAKENQSVTKPYTPIDSTNIAQYVTF